jgi:DNA-binding XRE family transcriptional regulator
MVESVPHLRSVPNASSESDALSRTRREPLWRHMLGDQLRQLRHGRGETLGETASRAGVSPQYLSEMERGVMDPSSEMIAAVASALDVTLVDLTLAVAESLQSTQAGTVQGTTCQAAFALAA